MSKRLSFAVLALLAGASPAFAHLNPAEHGSFMAGISHPLTGLDHILAMVAVGLWAAQLGGRAVYVIPAAFVGTMVLGFALGLGGVSLPFVEPVVAASVLALGLLVATSAKLPAGLGASLVGIFALFHGVAHAGEIGGAGALRFALGFIAATAILHAAGGAMGLLLGRRGKWLPRALGAGTAAAGLALMLG